VIVLSHFQIKPILEARHRGHRQVEVSTDLNMTTTSVRLDEAGIIFPDGHLLGWADAEGIADSDTKCFRLDADGIEEIRGYSEVTNWARSLFPTEGAPTMLVSGIPMHRIKGVDPHRDTLKKIKAVAPVYGEVLDTATGLGYTAIEASRTADNVVTVELDPLSLEIAKQNPWSARLFTSANIQQIVGDVYDVIEEIDSERFSCVIHDPPMFNLAGDLYSREFYTEIFRVLKRRGRVFHYIGDLTSKSGQGVVRGASQRLLEVGFSRVQKRPEAFGIVAYK
jgi:predicted methyltransferase